MNINELILADSHRHVEAVLLWLKEISPEKKPKWVTLHFDSTLPVSLFVQKPDLFFHTHQCHLMPNSHSLAASEGVNEDLNPARRCRKQTLIEK